MLKRIDLQHFKCFELLKLPLGSLTLLSGQNASGKSSVIQALVLLHQTMLENEWSQHLMLNGNTVKLGTVADVIDQEYGYRSCGITLQDEDEQHFQWTFSGERSAMSLLVEKVHVRGVGIRKIDENALRRYLLPYELFPSDEITLTQRLIDLTYLAAERIGPRDIYPLEDSLLTPVVGPGGEHAVSILYSNRDKNVWSEIAIEDEQQTLLHQVEARMRQFFPGCDIMLEKIPRVNAVALGLRTSRNMDFHRPTHTGFGLTQLLPLFVAALSAQKDDLILIENPEVHLHPAGQALIGEFLTEVASVGIQVIVESHSDHVLNGIRRAVKKKIISPESVLLHFFQPRIRDRVNSSSQVQSPNIDKDGNLDNWPDGFFDQFDKDMNYFAGWH